MMKALDADAVHRPGCLPDGLFEKNSKKFQKNASPKNL
jgi:hypothetical protein